MGKFAAVYDLPAGEEMLVVLCEGICGPAVQYISEINGELEVAEVELCGPEDGPLEKLSAREEARGVIHRYTDEDIKEFRRQLVKSAASRKTSEEKTHG